MREERSKMDFTLRAANVEDCKDMARMITVRRRAAGRATPVPAAGHRRGSAAASAVRSSLFEIETQTGGDVRGTYVGPIKMSVLCRFIPPQAALNLTLVQIWDLSGALQDVRQCAHQISL